MVRFELRYRDSIIRYEHNLFVAESIRPDKYTLELASSRIDPVQDAIDTINAAAMGLVPMPEWLACWVKRPRHCRIVFERGSYTILSAGLVGVTIPSLAQA
jgi:hypothetical protein